MIIVNKYNGLGNSIIQLSNIIDIALFYKHNISFKVTHKYFNQKIIENYFSKYKNKEILTCNKNFFCQSSGTHSFPIDIFKENKKRNDLLKKAFLIKDIKKLDENDLVIHIRSSDIFGGISHPNDVLLPHPNDVLPPHPNYVLPPHPNDVLPPHPNYVLPPHPNYVPPPLAYYIKYINKNKCKQIIIVCEDKINPVVNKLLELYKNATYKKNTLDEDIKIILGATNLIFSVGTFAPSLLRFSNYIKNCYGKCCNNEELKDYYLIMKPWKNTKEQRDYILNYKYD